MLVTNNLGIGEAIAVHQTAKLRCNRGFLRSAKKTGGITRIAVLGLILDEYKLSQDGGVSCLTDTCLNANGVGGDAVALEPLQGLQEVFRV